MTSSKLKSVGDGDRGLFSTLLQNFMLNSSSSKNKYGLRFGSTRSLAGPFYMAVRADHEVDDRNTPLLYGSSTDCHKSISWYYFKILQAIFRPAALFESHIDRCLSSLWPPNIPKANSKYLGPNHKYLSHVTKLLTIKCSKPLSTNTS